MQKRNSNETNSPGYCEYLVDGFASSKIVFVRIFSIIAALALGAALFKLLSFIPQVIFIWIIVLLFFVIMAFRLTRREFEYIVSFGEFNVDIIYGKSRRKNLVKVKISEVSKIFAVTGFKDSKISSLNAKNILYTCSLKAREMYCIHINDTAIVFSSCTKLNDCLKYYNRVAFS